MQVSFKSRKILAILALATVCLLPALQSEKLWGFAQPKTEEATSDSPNQVEIQLPTIALNEFTFMDYLRVAKKAYLDPQGLSEKSLVFAYELEDSEYLEVLDEIYDSISNHAEFELLESGWFIGPVEVNRNSNGQAAKTLWKPWSLEQFRSEAEKEASMQKILYASSLPIPGQREIETYWIPYSKFAFLIEMLADSASNLEGGELSSC